MTALATCATAAPDSDNAEAIARGRYVVLTGHCNNCHTAGYSARMGDVPETEWLMGNPVGWRGRQGTVYAINLRRHVSGITEDEWVELARTARPRAPMPWWSLKETSEADLRAMYKFIRTLQPVGSAPPVSLGPDVLPEPPYTQLPDLSVDPPAARP